ncbi:MAG: hypothetical protein DLM69_00245 [Candidatus Chloroheliales bacterium]|nr:MAG: hypothetical protein DLM69_00245 [Chloroflexota bacterium]
MNNRPVNEREQRQPLSGDVFQGLNDLGVKNIQVSLPTTNFKPPDTRNLGRDLVNSWLNILTHPTIGNFKEQGARTTWTVAITSVLIMGLVAGIVGAVRGIIGNFIFGIIGAIPSLLLTPFVTLGGFFLVAIVLYLVAHRLGGNGDFPTQTKLLALIAPLYSLALLISAPHNLIFGILGGLVGAYVVYLMWLMVRATHNLNERNAALIVALPALLVLLGVIF